jgi:hypothetical protein
MTFGVLDDYIELTALWKIGLVVLLVAVIVPMAFSTAIVGEARRKEGGSAAIGGTVLLGVGGLIVAAAVVAGIWAMTQK